MMDPKTRYSMMLRCQRIMADLPRTSVKRRKAKTILMALAYSASLPTVNRALKRLDPTP